MPTTTQNYPFSGGVDAVAGYGDRWNITFGGTWGFQDGWSIAVASTAEDFTLGSGNLFRNNLGTVIAPMTVCFTYRNRVYMGLVSQFNYSNGSDPIPSLNPTEWEEQYAGAGFTTYLSNYGSQDAIVAFGVLQGRLLVLAGRSIQIWQVDADPSNFQLIQVLDNVGVLNNLAVQQVGDSDVVFLDATGVRSAKAKEVTLNAEIDDVGSPIDIFIQAAIAATNGGVGACTIVEPETTNFWLYLNGLIYVLSRHRSAKISAWSTYEPRGSDNTTFVPQKFITHNQRVYCRSTTRGLYLYGGSSNSTYDQYAVVTFQTPYLDDKRPGTKKLFQGLSSVQEGKWSLQLSADPQSNNFVEFANRGTAATPNVLTDSTYDIGNIESMLQGTHFSLKGVSANTSVTLPAVFSSAILYYNPAEVTG